MVENPRIRDCFITIVTGEFTGGYLTLPSMLDITGDSHQVDWQQKPIALQVQPVTIYRHTSPRHISFSIRFVAIDSFEGDVVANVEWIRSLAFPDKKYNVSGSETDTKTNAARSVTFPTLVNFETKPPVVIIALGKFLLFRGIVKSFDVQWETQAVDLDTKIPLSAIVSFSLDSLYRNTSVDLADVRLGLMNKGI